MIGKNNNYFKLNSDYSIDSNIIDKINEDIHIRLETTDISIKKIASIIEYLIRRYFYFDIEKFINERYFINIIQYKVLDEMSHIDREVKLDVTYCKKFGSFIVKGRSILRDLIDILYDFNNLNNETKDTIIERILLSYNLLYKHFTENEINPFDNSIIYEQYFSIEEEVIFDYYFNEQKKAENMLIESDLKKETEKNIDEHEDKYKAIYDLLKDYITYASPEKIKKIIQYKINKEIITKEYNKTYFVLQENKVLNAAKIGYCFCLKKDEITHFIRIKEKGNRIKINKSIPNEKIIRGVSPLDNTLIKIRNEYLYEIDPNVFPLI